MRKYREETTYGNDWFRVIKGVAFALVFCFLSAVVFANVLRAKPLTEKTVYMVNQTVKVFAVVVAALLFVRGGKGWLKGGIIGLLFTALSYLTFSALGGDFALSGFIVAEMLLNVVAGAVGGIIAVNVK